MSAVLDSKLRKALELRTDSPAMLDALDSMATFWSSNTLEAVRNPALCPETPILRP